jgi:hypothetical protein
MRLCKEASLYQKLTLLSNIRQGRYCLILANALTYRLEIYIAPKKVLLYWFCHTEADMNLKIFFFFENKIIRKASFENTTLDGIPITLKASVSYYCKNNYKCKKNATAYSRNM